MHTGAHAKFPDLKKLEPEYLAELLARSNLSASDRQIAVSAIQWEMTYADIGVALGESDRTRELDRSTIGRRMRTRIVPRLRELIEMDYQKESEAEG